MPTAVSTVKSLVGSSTFAGGLSLSRLNFRVFVERVLIDSQDEPNLKINGAQNSSNKSFNSVGFNGREKAFDDYSQLNQSEAEDGDKGGECENSFLERMLDGQANLIAKQESN